MSNAEQFLDLYKTLEDLLTKKYDGLRLRHTSVVMEFIDDVDGQPYKEKLDLCRQVRNLLTHTSTFQGEPFLQPSDALILVLKEIVEFVRKPPLALSFATLRSEMMTASLQSKILPLVERMRERGFSHVPVIQKERFFGVFSWNVLISYMLDQPDFCMQENTTLREIASYLPIETHTEERYRFMPQSSTYYDLKNAFEQHQIKNRRLACIFITQNGTPKENLLGLVTPWDMLEEKLPRSVYE